MNSTTTDIDTEPSTPDNLMCANFEQVEAAVNETERGRWFLYEFSRRQRALETAEILTALERLTRRVAAYESVLAQSPRGGVNGNEAQPVGLAPVVDILAVAEDGLRPSRPRCDLSERLASLREIDALDTEAKVRMFA